MKKMFLTLLSASVVAVFFAAATPTQAGPPEVASGKWFYLPVVTGAREAGCNLFLETIESSWWTGTFLGTSTETGNVVAHCNGKWSFNAIVEFDSVVVDDRWGTLTMSVVGSKPNIFAEWYGHWVITGGTDGLANLRGQGNFWGIGFVPPAPGQPPVDGEIDYDGIYHFEP